VGNRARILLGRCLGIDAPTYLTKRGGDLCRVVQSVWGCELSKRAGLAEEASLRDDWAFNGLFVYNREEIIKQPQGGKPAVDRERRESL
jgi:hypothetical protein